MCVVKQELKEGKEKNEVNVTRKPEKKYAWHLCQLYVYI